MIPVGTRVPRSRDNLLIVCGQYFTFPFGQMHSRNPRVIELARLLGRTPFECRYETCEPRVAGPAHRARGIKGLANHTRADELMWSTSIEKELEAGEALPD